MSDYRLFIAIPLPDEVRQALAAIQRQLQQAGPVPVRWVKPEQMHLTLQFLGNVPSTQVEALTVALSRSLAPCPQCRLKVVGVGAFPNVRRPRVIWAGIEGQNKRLVDLQAAVVTATQPLGFEPEARPFKAHLTLGRIDKRAASRDYKVLGERISQAQGEIGQVATFAVDQVALMHSQLKPSGPIYTTLHRVTLAGQT